MERFALFVGALALVACAPQVESQTPRSISICRDSMGSAQEAANIAIAHCRQQGLQAREEASGHCGFTSRSVLARYSCVQ